MVKANIRVYGSVQAVGYRVFVKNVARLMNVRGLVRNLEDGSVEVFAEAEEDTLEKFLKAIDVKGRPGDMLSLNVDRIEVRREGEPGYTGPWRTYSLFEVDYGEEAIRPIEREMVESLEWAKIYFTKLVSEFTDYRQEFRDFREEFRGFRSESLKISSEILSELRDFREEFRAFRDESLKISSETLNEVRELRRDLKAILDERLVKIEKDIAEIKARLGLL
ncbi:MAG: acylphosphatase [Thaumarchaeota archaeon]|nr:acylphosphatase [Candidatus Geocrenenecus arthurdayi]MCL7389020.1 acylphosphatase [Candidatus Geocrenenecus arthurdayi]